MSDRTPPTDGHGEDEFATADTSVPADRIVAAYTWRDLRTAVVTPSTLALCLGTAVLVLALAVAGGSFEAGYVGVMLDLLLPLQLLVPVLAFAIGYSTVVGDRRRGELDLLRTYPVRGWQLIIGSFIARGLALVVAIAVPLVVVGALAALGEPPRVPMYATHTGGDSPVLYLRFLILTIAFALAMLAIAIGLSALVSSHRSALIAGALAVVALVVGLDIAVIVGFSSEIIGVDALVETVAISPLSAYRGLVFETGIQVVAETGPATASVPASVASLVAWTVTSLVVGALAIHR